MAQEMIIRRQIEWYLGFLGDDPDQTSHALNELDKMQITWTHVVDFDLLTILRDFIDCHRNGQLARKMIDKLTLIVDKQNHVDRQSIIERKLWLRGHHSSMSDVSSENETSENLCFSSQIDSDGDVKMSSSLRLFNDSISPLSERNQSAHVHRRLNHCFSLDFHLGEPLKPFRRRTKASNEHKNKLNAIDLFARLGKSKKTSKLKSSIVKRSRR